MKINYTYVNPGGNPTVFVTSKINRSAQPKIAKNILNKSFLGCEQVGFIERAQNPKAIKRLQMMGGEFCGNAIRALGAVIALQRDAGLKGGRQFYLEASGVKQSVLLNVQLDKKGGVESSFEANIKIVKLTERSIRLKGVSINAKQVNFLGMTQFILPVKYFDEKMDFKDYFVKLYRSKKIKTEAGGFIFYQKLGVNIYKIIPIIYVRKTDSLFMETSCASGSLALQAAFKKLKLQVLQPSGSYLWVEKNLQNGCVSVGGKIGEIKMGVLQL